MPRRARTLRAHMPIRTDYHMHTPLCKHAAGPLEAYVERAIELGLEEIGFSDHNPLPGGRGSNVRMDEAQLEQYVASILQLRDDYRGQIVVRLGLEMDYLDQLLDYLRQQISRYPWDYIVGSVHYLNSECTVGSWSHRQLSDPPAHYARYFALVRDLAASGLCDIIAHFDIPRRSGPPPSVEQQADVTATLQAIQTAGTSVEINTSGFRHGELPQSTPYPDWPIIEELIRLGVPLSVNSDAHAPEHVAAEFPQVERFLRAKGCRQLCRFAGRVRTMYEL